MVKVKNISKKFTDTVALDNVSFDLKPARIYGFLGPNGAGKTTTMRIMTGFLKPDSGEVDFQDQSIADNNHELLNKIGYLPENNPLYENMRVDELLLFVNEAKFADKEQLKVIAVECGLTSVLTKEIGELSKGYKQRVGLAKALIGDPDYLILDEPSTGLDPNQKSEILDLIKKAGSKKTILFSSHVLTEVETIADELIIINKGEIIAKGSADAIGKKNFNSNKVIAEISGSPKDIKTKLGKVKSIIEVQTKASGKSKFNKYEILTSDNKEAAVAIFNLAVKEKWLLAELHKEANNLEDLFKQLTHK